MDFHEDQDDHEVEEEEEEEEMGIPEAYNSLQLNSIRNQQPPTTATATPPLQLPPPLKPRYRECLKNHAVGIGGLAVDGCGEFMPAGPENTLDALKCAACNCHRNFHRKEPATTTTELIPRPRNHHELFFHGPVHNLGPCYRPPTGYLQLPPQARPLALPSTSGGGGSGGGREDNYQEDISGSSKKRFRTKFTQEQKEKMLTLAENLGWRIQKHDEDAVQQFCNETGVTRHVFKVWMHNNKHTLGKKP